MSTILPGSRPASEGVFAGISAHKTIWQREQKYSLAYDFEQKDWEVETVTVKAGQGIIFTEKTMHSSFPNNSQDRRLAIIGRYVHPSTQVYPYRWQGDFIDENGHNIKKHYSMLVAGENRYQHNVVRDWHDLNESEVEFQQNLNQVRFGQVEIPEDKQQLSLYGLEKQALEGDCQETEPNPILHPRQYIQWQAWDQYRGMSSIVAMDKYSQLVASLPQKTASVAENGNQVGQAEKPTATEIENWFISYLAELLEIEANELDLNSSFQSYGLSSAEGVGMIGDLQDWLGESLNPALIYEYPNIAILSAQLAQKVPVLR